MVAPVTKKPPNGIAPSVYMLTPGGPLPRDWEVEIRLVGIRPEKVSSFAALKMKVDLNPDLILVLRYGQNEDLGLQLLTKILKHPELHGIALIVVGQEAESVRAELQKVMRFVSALEEPCSAKEFLKAIERADASKVDHVKEKQAREASTSFRGSTPPQEKFAEKLFDYLRGKQLDKLTLGGQRYVEATKSVVLLDEFIEKDSEDRQMIEPILKGGNSWIRNHVCRTAYMTDRILIGLGVAEDKRRIARLAAILRAKAFVDRSRLLRSDYTREGDEGLQREIAETLRLSARYVSEKIGDPKISSMVSLCACYFEQQRIESDDFTLASAILISDVVERYCWSMGFFNSLRAYMLLKRWKSGAIPKVEFGVVCLAAKFLSEGIVAVPFKSLIPKGVKLPKREKANETTGVYVVENGRLVPVEALSPGMRLLSPLVTYDGREILQSDIQLDDDLIWRIWQLASIRPIRSACISN